MSPEIIQARKILVRILLLIGAFIVLFLVYQFLKNGQLKLSFDNAETTGTVRIIKQDDGTEYSVDSFSDGEFKKTMSPGDYEVRVFNAENQSTIYFLSVNTLRRTTEQAVEFHNQNVRSKLSREVESCPFLLGDNLFSHNCYSLGYAYSHSKLTKDSYPTKTIEPKFAYGEGGVLASAAYDQGTLLLQYDSSSYELTTILSYVGPTGNMKRIKLPDSYNKTQNKLTLITDTSGGSSFVIVDNRGKNLAYYKDISAEPILISLENELKSPPEVVEIWVDLRSDKLLIASGIPTSEIDRSVENEKLAKYYRDPEDIEVRIYDPDNVGSFTKTRIAGSANNVRLCQDNTVCVFGVNNLAFYAIDEEDADKVAVVNGVTSYQPTVDMGVVYTQDSRLYSYDIESSSAKEIFSSSKFTTSNIVNTKDGLLVNAILENDDTLKGAHTFLITNKENKDSSFIDNYFPYRNKDFGYVRGADYYKNLVVVDVLLDSWTSPVGLDSYTYDEAEFNRKKDFILKDLKKNGIAAPEYNIIVKP